MDPTTILPRFVHFWPGKSEGPHPAVYHMLDVAAVAEQLIAAEKIPLPRVQAFVLLAALHDLGKVNRRFKAMLLDGAPQGRRHWEVSEALLNYHADALLRPALGIEEHAFFQIVAATAGHHGKPPTASRQDLRRMRRQAGEDAVEDAGEIIREFTTLWPDASFADLDEAEAVKLSWWLPGFIACADWIGSNTEWFPPAEPDLSLAEYLAGARQKAEHAVAEAGLVSPGSSDTLLFDFEYRPMQAATATIPVPDGPVLAIIEDETGAGKTEAALILAQRLLMAGKGRGLYFALPTMATANAMFDRMAASARALFVERPTLTLAHGRATLSARFRDLIASDSAEEDAPGCTQWLADNRRRALLADIGVGTIDQALLSILPTRHNCLRHYGLSSKILIVDEVHEMGNPYMAKELAQLLRAHRAAGGSAILLTATLPLEDRAKLVAAWGEMPEDDPAYPALTIAGGASRRDLPSATGKRGPVTVRRLETTEDAIRVLSESARSGAACVWVRNAVDDAISACEALRACGIDADLLHARFALTDRMEHETAALARFSRHGQGRAGRVLVATQVVESSLDLDFDVMVSDLAPMAALIQRAGRLWRHMDTRPFETRPVSEPVLHVLSPDPDQVEDERWLGQVLDRGQWVYPLALQWRSARVLFAEGQIEAPGRLRILIEAVHGAGAEPVPMALENAETGQYGRDRAEANHARQNVINLTEGYRMGGGGWDDVEYPTRLGRPQKTLLLMRQDGSRLMPWGGGQGLEAEVLSQVQAAETRFTGITMPDQSTDEIVSVTRDWPDWKRRQVTVCPVAESGWIADGLIYDPERGLLFCAPDDQGMNL